MINKLSQIPNSLKKIPIRCFCEQSHPLESISRPQEYNYENLHYLKMPTHDYPRTIKRQTASAIRAFNQEIQQNLNPTNHYYKLAESKLSDLGFKFYDDPIFAYTYFIKQNAHYNLEVIFQLTKGNVSINEYIINKYDHLPTHLANTEDQLEEDKRIRSIITQSCVKDDGKALSQPEVDKWLWRTMNEMQGFSTKDPMGQKKGESDFRFMECYANLTNENGNVLQMYGSSHDKSFSLLKINYYEDEVKSKEWMCLPLNNCIHHYKGPNLQPLSRNIQKGVKDLFEVNGFCGEAQSLMRFIVARREIELYMGWLYDKAIESHRLYDEKLLEEPLHLPPL